ncbi:hypothetical protein CTI12_AA476200 [Artemisia annua]|uniref:Uncharacterized protein n=1 Tax=Artemisia annua TaxID=35608 RepID=A0A2U1LM57_ARTAN|nr:hypothetical protein CTI12_AA476200 [Artemisia annua]
MEVTIRRLAMVVTHLKMMAELIQTVGDGGYAVGLTELTIRRGWPVVTIRRLAMVVTHLKMMAELIQTVGDGGYAVGLTELTIRRGWPVVVCSCVQWRSD